MLCRASAVGVQPTACNRQCTTCSVQPTTYNMQRATEPQGCNSALPRGECALRNARPHRSVIRRQHEQKPADLFPRALIADLQRRLLAQQEVALLHEKPDLAPRQHTSTPNHPNRVPHSGRRQRGSGPHSISPGRADAHRKDSGHAPATAPNRFPAPKSFVLHRNCCRLALLVCFRVASLNSCSSDWRWRAWSGEPYGSEWSTACCTVLRTCCTRLQRTPCSVHHATCNGRGLRLQHLLSCAKVGAGVRPVPGADMGGKADAAAAPDSSPPRSPHAPSA